jgi:hypothetical protein
MVSIIGGSLLLVGGLVDRRLDHLAGGVLLLVIGVGAIGWVRKQRRTAR